MKILSSTNDSTCPHFCGDIHSILCFQYCSSHSQYIVCTSPLLVCIVYTAQYQCTDCTIVHSNLRESYPPCRQFPSGQISDTLLYADREHCTLISPNNLLDMSDIPLLRNPSDTEFYIPPEYITILIWLQKSDCVKPILKRPSQ